MPYKNKDVKKSNDKEYSRAYYQKHKKKLLNKQKIRLSDPLKLKQHKDTCEARRQYNLKEIEGVKLHYGCQNPECKWNSDFESCDLDLHHIDRELKENSLGKMPQSSMKKIVEEINKCVVLCAICHRRLHSNKISLRKISPCRVKLDDTKIVIV